MNAETALTVDILYAHSSCDVTNSLRGHGLSCTYPYGLLQTFDTLHCSECEQALMVIRVEPT